ncbi:ABC transporter ATP-binding protein [Candidatus Gracilibacteria bacterium]|nr:ABC transporter ATP-binding protein [Candidatus Gracilibacteria bacterium]
MKPALEIKNLHKIYPSGTTALANLSLTIEQGEFFALLGPNGAGKTSLISILAGPKRKTSGTIKVCGLDLDTHREQAKFLLGIVPQEVTFDPFFTVNEALILQSGYYGLRQNQTYIDEILEKLGLADKKHSSTRALSGGMKRRLLIAQALVHKPKIVVLDEPTAGVDVELRHGLWTYMKELNKQGTTILLTTHYLEEAEQLCHRTAIINQGQLIALDQTKKLIRSLGNKKSLTLSFKDPIKQIPPSLNPYTPQILDKYDLEITFDQTDLQKILAQIHKFDLTDLTLKSQNLEDVFIKLTHRDNA